MTDPDLTFDALGNAYLIVEPLKFGADLITIGMYVYKSSDQGKTWSKPVHLHTDAADDKQWIDLTRALRARIMVPCTRYGARIRPCALPAHLIMEIRGSG